MSIHIFNRVPHDDGRGHDSLVSRHLHVSDTTTRTDVTNSENWGLGSPAAGEPGTPDRGTVGTAAPAGRLSPLVRAAAVGYAIIGALITAVAFALAPWGLLLLVLATAAFAVAALLALMAAGFAAIERDER